MEDGCLDVWEKGYVHTSIRPHIHTYDFSFLPDLSGVSITVIRRPSIFGSCSTREMSRELFDEPAEEVGAAVLVDDVAAAELDPRLDLVAVFEEAAGVLRLEVEVVVVRVGAEADLFELDLVGLLALLLLLLLLLVAELPEVHNLGYGRVRIGGYLDEVEAAPLGEFEGCADFVDAVLALRVHDAHAVGADLVVDASAGAALLYRPGVSSSDGSSPSGDRGGPAALRART